MIRIILAISFTLLFAPELTVVAAQPSRSSVSGFELQDFISGIDPAAFTGIAPCVPKPGLPRAARFQPTNSVNLAPFKLTSGFGCSRRRSGARTRWAISQFTGGSGLSLPICSNEKNSA